MTPATALVPAFILFAVVVSGNALKSQLQGRSKIRNQAQNRWRVYSPPDKSFVVELPRQPRRTNRIDPTSTDERSLFKCTKSVDAYELQLKPRSPEYAFVIGVFDVSGCKRTPETFTNDVKALVATMGGDQKSLIKDEQVEVHGLPGREFIYQNGDLYGRVLVVNAGKRIYLLTYTNEVGGATTSAETTRMFSSFRPVRKRFVGSTRHSL